MDQDNLTRTVSRPIKIQPGEGIILEPGRRETSRQVLKDITYLFRLACILILPPFLAYLRSGEASHLTARKQKEVELSQECQKRERDDSEMPSSWRFRVTCWMNS